MPSFNPTVTATMSKWAADLRFEHLSKEAVYQAKRFLLDSVGCALGGYQQHDVAIALEVLREIAGHGSATVIGSGEKADIVSAALANALMIRCIRPTFFQLRLPVASELAATVAS
jgi:2-methylcitrate dehydratase